MDLFRIGAQCGLLPNQVLDMSLDVFTAYVDGCSDKLFEQQIIAVQTGYWAAYYQSKHPRPVNKVIEGMRQKRAQLLEKKSKKRIKAPEVDVDTFKDREKRFKERMGR